MEGRQVLTAVSDLILGSCAFYSSSILWSRRHVHVPSKLPDDLVPIVGCLGFFIISLAAFAGVVRFAKLLPSLHTSVVSIHEKLALLGSLTAIPLIAAEYSKQTKYPEILWIFVTISILSPVVSLMLNKQAAMRELSTTTSFIFIIVVSVLLSRYTVNINGLFGSLCFVVGGLLVGTQGKGMFGLNNVDWFHYILSIGVIALERGMY